MKREEMAMEKVFEAINGVFSFIGPLSDFLWEFPTNFDWYSSIPILGNISFAIILLLGSGIFFSFRIGFMQVTYFKKGIRTMTEKRVVETGISPLASFFLSSAMRVGPGNILGVTGAIAVGGPGPCSGCGYLRFSGWQLHTWRVSLLRFSRRRRTMSS